MPDTTTAPVQPLPPTVEEDTLEPRQLCVYDDVLLRFVGGVYRGDASERAAAKAAADYQKDTGHAASVRPV